MEAFTKIKFQNLWKLSHFYNNCLYKISTLILTHVNWIYKRKCHQEREMKRNHNVLHCIFQFPSCLALTYNSDNDKNTHRNSKKIIVIWIDREKWFAISFTMIFISFSLNANHFFLYLLGIVEIMQKIVFYSYAKENSIKDFLVEKFSFKIFHSKFNDVMRNSCYYSRKIINKIFNIEIFLNNKKLWYIIR